MSPPLEPAGPLDLVLVTRVVDFAALKHRGQRRKGAAGEPYFNHLAEVAFLVAQATEGRDPLVVLGALLHDTIEDTLTTEDELEAEFGAEVARLVAEVTDEQAAAQGGAEASPGRDRAPQVGPREADQDRGQDQQPARDREQPARRLGSHPSA